VKQTLHLKVWIVKKRTKILIVKYWFDKSKKYLTSQTKGVILFIIGIVE